MDAATYVLCRGYVKKTAIALGAVKGAPCTIKSITDTDGGHTVTFEWTGDNDVKQTTTMFVKDGEDGVSVSSVAVSSGNHLICTMSDGSTIDAGAISVTTELTSPITTNTNVGGIESGTTYPAGTDIEDIITDMLVEYEMPSVALTITPGTLLYDAVNDSVEEIEMSANIQRGTEDITSIEFRVNSDTVYSPTPEGAGTYQYTYHPDSPITSDTSLSVRVGDGSKVAVAPVNIRFVPKSYYGVVESDVVNPTSEQIKALSSILKTTKEYTLPVITASYAKIVYAYPKSFGVVSSIVDVSYGINYESSFTVTEVEIDGYDYYVYTQTDPSSIENIKLRFS